MEALTQLPGGLWTTYRSGGFVMHAITLCALFSVTTILYKLVVFHQAKVDLNEFIARLRGALLKGNVKGAIDVCEAQRGPVALIVKAGLLRFGRPREEMERTMETAAIHEVAELEKYLPVLATVSSMAPLLGFLGTVVGLILSFETIAERGLNAPDLVARGVWVALLTTAWGLIVACTSQPFYNYFTSKVARHTREMETAANILFETLDEMEPGSGSGRAVGA